LKSNRVELLDEIRENLERLNEKIDLMLKNQKSAQKAVPSDIPAVLDSITLLSLPDHLRKTLVTLHKLREATAKEVAIQTRRARAVESGYLNQLVTMGYMKKERVGRKAYFYVNKKA
jgi:response regulator of citrate/malate metabolism